jgi:membrane-associated phospholipid phosphatase
MGVPLFIQAFQLASTFAVIVTLLITLKWKVSAHLVGIGGIIGLIIILLAFYHFNLFIILVISIMLAGCIAFARLSLNEHTPGQVYVGLVIGVLIMMGTLLLF